MAMLFPKQFECLIHLALAIGASRAKCKTAREIRGSPATLPNFPETFLDRLEETLAKQP